MNANDQSPARLEPLPREWPFTDAGKEIAERPYDLKTEVEAQSS